MRFALTTCALSALAMVGCAAAPESGDDEGTNPEQTTEAAPPMLGVHWARDVAARQDAERKFFKNPNMVFHYGKIMTTAVTKNIFWGTSWANYTGDKMTGLDTWYSGFGGSNYDKTNHEYTGTNGQVGITTTHQGHLVDTSAASGGNNTLAILAEVCKMITSPDASGNGYYAVYTDLPRGNAGYCAWHSAGNCSGKAVQFAFFWKLDGDAGCDPKDASGQHSQGLAALANVTGHELSEALTDPNGGGWYDWSGKENGDKCAWTFNVPLVSFTNGSQWKIQGEWSNAAYTAGTGYPNSSAQKGCLDGH